MDKDVVHMHTGILLSCEQEWHNGIWSNMDGPLEIIIVSEVIQKEKDNTLLYHLHESKIWCKWTYLWNRNLLTDIENRLVIAKGEGRWRREGLEVWS